MQQYNNSIKEQIKKNINALVNSGNIKQAKDLINEYMEIIADDSEIYSIYAVISILEGNLDYAEELLKEGLNLCVDNFDLNYNLAYLYHIEGNISNSLKYYKNAYNYAENKNMKNEIKDSIEKLVIENQLDMSVDKFINSKRCLILCDFFSVYTKNFLEKLKENYDIQFDILTMDENYKIKINKNIVNNVYIYKSVDELTNVLNSVEPYDIIHIHFLEPYYGLVAKQIIKKCNKLIVTIWGSDYYRTSQEDKNLQKNILEIADNINFGNENTLINFNNYYNKLYANKLSICRFGLIQLEYIKAFRNDDKFKIKELLSLPKDSVIITCGYNASPAQNHLRIIESILKVKKKLLNNCYFLFPMTYGDKNLVLSISEKLKESKINYRIYDEFLSEEDTAKLRLASDIMIQVQTTDQLSGSMQEYLYADNVVITGKWLPYSIFKNKGMYFIEVDKIEDVGNKLVYSAKTLHKLKNKCSKNKEIIWNMTSWEKAINNWIDVYKN